MKITIEVSEWACTLNYRVRFPLLFLHGRYRLLEQSLFPWRRIVPSTLHEFRRSLHEGTRSASETKKEMEGKKPRVPSISYFYLRQRELIL